MARYPICKNLNSDKCHKKELVELDQFFDRYGQDKEKYPARAEVICQTCTNFRNH